MVKKKFKERYRYIQGQVKEWRREGAGDFEVTCHLIICVTACAGTEYESNYTETQLDQIFNLRYWEGWSNDET